MLHSPYSGESQAQGSTPTSRQEVEMCTWTNADQGPPHDLDNLGRSQMEKFEQKREGPLTEGG